MVRQYLGRCSNWRYMTLQNSLRILKRLSTSNTTMISVRSWKLVGISSSQNSKHELEVHAPGVHKTASVFSSAYHLPKQSWFLFVPMTLEYSSAYQLPRQLRVWCFSGIRQATLIKESFLLSFSSQDKKHGLAVHAPGVYKTALVVWSDYQLPTQPCLFYVPGNW